ncbi:class I SAM-dependent methyltransferase [Frondihabitans australicus]|uniref:2-polyprenyl-3-methyl-5-hydroxy-6-metoxy-1, 4-benzoquinol methylase n=1 Tax=Frondihabitans australicus TaxID=386892 RepID=A0A495IDA4_9MICO|nr:class I SAM-dependent methyltransferase [Frondihabitans australicus]RKR73085.1 2-polyprenyl-3-methyl-5-hydroxy-6-metoxy-1,4-benzoquinol methylase [Frondihabitans australicus]
MIDLSRRETALPELMDDPDCDLDALHRTYGHFVLVNRLVAGWRPLYRRRIRPLLSPAGAPTTLLDLGSGGGDVARALAAWARRDGLRLDVTGADPDDRAHAYATAQPQPPGVTFVRAASRDLVAEGRRFDLVVSNHVVHHLDAAELAGVLRDSEGLAGRLVLHNDIARGRLAYGAYWAATVAGFRGSFIHPDGLLSIRRSYRADELRRAIPAGWRVERPWPFRLVLSFTPGAQEHANA